MSVTSPKSATPGVSILEWDEAAVQSFLADLGLGKYEQVVYEHGITGDVLSVMDHATLQDLGMSSLGHRLNLLRAVWELKREQGVELGEDDWKPQEINEEQKVTHGHVDKLWDLIMIQHERLIHLERAQNRMLSALHDNGIPLPTSAGADVDRVQGIPGMEAAKPGLDRTGSLRWRGFNGAVTDGSDVEAGPSRADRRASTLFPSSLASSTNSNAPLAPVTSDTPTFQDSFTPTTTSTAYPFGSPRDRGDLSGPDTATQKAAQPLARVLSGNAVTSAGAASPPAHTMTGNGSATPDQHNLAPPPGPSAPSTSTSPTVANSQTKGSSSVTNGPSDKVRSQANADARSAAKSFRVTLEDPCWKVLPAALKKYKINDDWKLYALFICFDNTERCLSYDEKPLLLFQKLKETGHRPVFMLRHIKDVRSPIAVAQQKQAQKLGLPVNSGINLLPKIKPTTDRTVSPTKASLQPALNRGDGGHTPNGGAFPELPSPGLKEGDGLRGPHKTGSGNLAAGPGGGNSKAGGTLIEREANTAPVTYAVAIYPYIADRQDEFDVAVGSTYVILSKAKGWYIVERDPDGMGKPTDAAQGWVPAGCLLELSQPISVVSPTLDGEIAQYPGLSILPPSAIISSSYPGNALMDYAAKDDAELSLKEGEKVRVYKKYCHWIKSDTGERGWVPAWFVGKALAAPSGQNTGGGDSMAPSSATTPTASTHPGHQLRNQQAAGAGGSRSPGPALGTGAGAGTSQDDSALPSAMSSNGMGDKI
ncbi:hypothetical protein IAU60_002740 [Kwoniella sp. DSM 27419]